MAEWRYKVRCYSGSIVYSSNVYPGKGEDFEKPEEVSPIEEKSMEEWLDWQCEGGWELFKFHPYEWCVFRKQI